MGDVGLVGLTNVVCQVGIAQQAVAAALPDPGADADVAAATGSGSERCERSLPNSTDTRHPSRRRLVAADRPSSATPEQASERLFTRAQVAATPMTGWGPGGERYLRLVFANEPSKGSVICVHGSMPPSPEVRLDGGRAGGAVRVGDTVRRAAGPWTPAVHALLAHLADQKFAGSPRPLGTDRQGREMLTFLEGRTVGSSLPWPEWVHADATLAQVAWWLRRYHDAVADFVPPAGAVWRMGGQWRPGLIIGHNDTAPYNAVWRDRPGWPDSSTGTWPAR